ncbi:MAG: F0F1 ATP synthase subunit B [Deltaproteobacteria bacterium]|nr:MAG: F0F1 ATP synthase subunit B [Deltaproteobacteria bacterium]
MQNRNLNALVALLCVLLLPALALASGGEGGHADSGAVLKDFIWRCVNFAVMAGLIGYFVSKPIRNGLQNRRADIEKALADATAAREAAEAKAREYQDKLAKAAAEIDTIYAAIRREGELERDKILASARDMAGKIEQEAEAKAASAVARARAELRAEAARLAVELAEELLAKNVTAADQKRLVDEYMQKVGELH